LRTADTLLKEAQIYEHEDNDQQAYLLLMRYAILVAERLQEHPDIKETDRPGLKAAQRNVKSVIHRLEALKPRISERYAAWEKALERRREASVVLDNGSPRPRSQIGFAASDPAVAGNPSTLAAADHGELAVELAHKEIKRRRATRQAGVSEEEEQERRTAGLWDDWEAALTKNGQNGGNSDEMRRDMEASRRVMDGQHDSPPNGPRKDSKPILHRVRPMQTTRNGSGEYRYPSIAKSQPLRYEDSQQSISPQRPPSYMPPKPPKERYDRPPPRPEKAPPLPPRTPPVEMPAPTQFTFRPSAYLENGNPLRTVFLPPTLREKFLQYAAPNTRRNLETCGMLCGTLISNALFISKVVIPEQESTSDTCDTVNEGALFDYCASEDLMVLGWIHTHPSQSCFMSSRDLHTHSGYQIMMPESIAIVCAPSKNPSWGVFRLTDPPGMQSVLNCRKSGLFHEHDEQKIYTDALRPGHVFEAEGLEFEVVDLRPK